MRSREEIEALFDYHAPSPEQVTYMEYATGLLKDLATDLLLLLWRGHILFGSPEVTVAIRKLHEARMLVNAAVINAGLKPATAEIIAAQSIPEVERTDENS